MRILVALALLLPTLVPARAQVAVPPLNPSPLLTVAANPAALVWEPRSLVAANVAGEGDYDATTLQARVVGDRLAAGAEYLDTDVELGPTPLGPAHGTVETAQAGAAARVGEGFGFGLGGARYDAVTAAGPLRSRLRTHSTVLGATWQALPAVFAGAVLGRETVRADDFEGRSRRALRRYGAAWRPLTAGAALHVEAYRSMADAYTVEPTPGATETRDASAANTWVVELVWAGVLAGLRHTAARNISRDDAGATLDRTERADRRWSVGWLGERGWALVLNRSQDRRTNTVTGAVVALGQTTLTLAWRF